MRHIHFPIALAVLSLCTLQVQGQLRTGISNSNYAGTNGVWLNPSSIVDSKVFLDIHFAGAGVFAHNNVAYIPDSRIYALLKEESYNNVAFNTSGNGNKQAFLDASVSGPAATLSIGQHGFGLHTAFRSYTAINRIPVEWADILVNGYQFQESFQGENSYKNVSAKNLSWAEFGGTYSRMLQVRNSNMLTGGISVKRLIGVNSSNITLNEYNMSVDDQNNAVNHQLRGNISYLEQPGWNTGRGWGFDVGFTYKKAIEGSTYDNYTPHTGNYRCESIDYRYKIGFSVLDIGSIKFDKTATSLTFDRDFDAEDNTEEIALPDSEDPQDLSEALFTEENANTVGSSFKAKLPTTLAATFDYNFGNNVYVNATVMQRLPRNATNGVHRNNLLAVTPRYERRHFEAAMPLSLYEYRYPMAGLTLRYRYLTIGTDNLIPYALKTDLYRADIYFHLKLPLYRNCSDRSAKIKTPKGKSNFFGQGRKPSKKPSRKYLRKKVGKCPTVVN